ncbi:hypothetical protein OH77DRAFT_402256 [Trametes cingulata]|nr:hypothetical protein OH77DRAFT_402256 [Trametes cingulata]
MLWRARPGRILTRRTDAFTNNFAGQLGMQTTAVRRVPCGTGLATTLTSARTTCSLSYRSTPALGCLLRTPTLQYNKAFDQLSLSLGRRFSGGAFCSKFGNTARAAGVPSLSTYGEAASIRGYFAGGSREQISLFGAR